MAAIRSTLGAANSAASARTSAAAPAAIDEVSVRTAAVHQMFVLAPTDNAGAYAAAEAANVIAMA